MNKKIQRVSIIGVLFAVLIISSCVFEGEQNMSGVYNTHKGVIIEGYDVVSYFSGTPQKGTKEFKVVHQGVEFYFVDDENKKLFLANPDKYIPAYGGWCAYAIGQSAEKVEVNPKTFKIIDGKNYLFYNKLLTNTLDLWNKDEKRLHQQAEVNWPKIKNN